MEQFISEPITPDRGGFSAELMVQGLAALPSGFTWRGRRYGIVACLEHNKQSGLEGSSSDGERYLRRQEFRVELDTGQEARIYVLRNALPGSSRSASKRRWFLYSISSGD